MRDSNVLLAACAADLRSGQGDEVSLDAELANRASWTALIGWDYAQTLPE